MSSGAAATAERHQPSLESRAERLMVTVRAGDDSRDRHRPYAAVGFLYFRDGAYEFAYTKGAVTRPDFVPLLGFGDVHRRYRSEGMFPLFGERIMSAKRPDRPDYLDALDLSVDSEPWEILGRSGGRRAGDTIEVVPEPQVAADGLTRSTFLVHGTRHRGERANKVIDGLRSGDRLILRGDPENPVNPLAIVVLGDEETELGYVPDPLVGFVHHVMMDPAHNLSVVRANGPEVGAHLRLLVRLEGRVEPDYRPFDGEEWQTLA